MRNQESNIGREPSPEHPKEIADLNPSFEATRTDTARLLERIDITVPTLAEFAREGGVQFERLGQAYKTMKGLKLEPLIAYAPVLKHKQWTNLYRALQDDPSVNHDGRIKNGGLDITGAIRGYWDELQSSENEINIDNVTWQVIVLPGTDKPPQVNLDHNGYSGYDGKHGLNRKLLKQAGNLGIFGYQLIPGRLHPTIATYLTIQANKLQSGEKPIDKSRETWLRGTLDGNKAPIGCWRLDYGQVNLNWNYVKDQSFRIGVRLPMWDKFLLVQYICRVEGIPRYYE